MTLPVKRGHLRTTILLNKLSTRKVPKRVKLSRKTRHLMISKKNLKTVSLILTRMSTLPASARDPEVAKRDTRSTGAASPLRKTRREKRRTENGLRRIGSGTPKRKPISSKSKACSRTM